ncbi:MDR family MFS transporter [Paenibacillus mendelii]|uniref:MFS-type drug efflux transporter P55 n=1 Tax=Paenibacillus mendelii TaxID=206163 RepID=A0ABV6J8F3_9BACL|nr:MDR family MFS transporter [Paenibacillus mendelii]MCQ6561281.1 MFS transporter [Paenibacillus mendelii]
MMKPNNKTLVLIALLLGLIFSELDQTVVSTAMPTIIKDLHGLSLYGWVAGVYMLSITMFMPIIGKLADLYGRRKVYLSCMALFMAGSIVSGLADSMVMLLIGRSIQGIGAGGLMPLALVIIGDTYPLEQRARIQSLFGPMMILPQLLGPTVGGYFVGHLNWHWIFLINIPIGLASAFLMIKGLRADGVKEKRVIDWAGAVTLVLAMLSLLLAPVLIDIRGYQWSSPVIIGLLVLSLSLIGVFIRIESRAKEPIIPLHLFRNRTIVVLSLLVFTTMLGIMGGTAAFPFFAQNVMGLSPAAAGYLTLAFMAGGIPASIMNGFLITKVRYRNLFIVSFLLPIVGFILLSRIGVETSVMYIVVSFFILGAGMGALFGGDNLIVQESVDKEHSGIALSTVQLFQSLGTTLGFSIFGSLLAKQIHSGISDIAQLPPGSASLIETGGIPNSLASELVLQVKLAFSHSFQNIFTISIGFAVAAFLICWFMKREVLTAKDEAAQNQQKSAHPAGL